MTNLETLKSLINLLDNTTTEISKKTSIDDSFINKYVIVRTYSAGVFAGTLKRKVGNEVELHDARRIWYWDGAASLSQLAEEGTEKPDYCKFPQEVKEILLIGVIEILKVTDKAKASIKEVPIWKK